MIFTSGLVCVINNLQLVVVGCVLYETLSIIAKDRNKQTGVKVTSVAKINISVKLKVTSVAIFFFKKKEAIFSLF